MSRSVAGSYIAAIGSGLAIAIVGAIPWVVLAKLNGRVHPELPWAGVATIAYLTALIAWLGGAGPPSGTKCEGALPADTYSVTPRMARRKRARLDCDHGGDRHNQRRFFACAPHARRPICRHARAGTFLASYLYGKLVQRTGSILPGMIVHVLGDASYTFFAILGGNAALLIAQ